MNRLTPLGRRVLAVAVIVAAAFGPARMLPASASTDKFYVAASGVPVIGCDFGDGVGGACLDVSGPATVHIAIHDAVSPVVVAYVDVDAQANSIVCGSGDVSVPAGDHVIGVWVGGANALRSPLCLPGQATTGTISFG